MFLCFPHQPGHSVGMLAAVEHGPILCSDSNILCLSWKGRVPKSEKDKPVCRRRYYEEGWLATGNGRGVVGVTFTSSHCRRDRSTPQRINFNLRGHNSEVWSRLWQYQYVFITVERLSEKQFHTQQNTTVFLSITLFPVLDDKKILWICNVCIWITSNKTQHKKTEKNGILYWNSNYQAS